MRSIPVSTGRRAGLAVAVALLAATATLLDTTAATSAPPRISAAPRTSVAQVDRVHTWSVRVHRGGPNATITFHRSRVGEAFVVATVSARGVSWAEPKNESAVVSVFVDGHYATDIVITSSGPVRREFALGRLGKGRHTLRLHYAADRSLSRAGVASLKDLRLRTVAASNRGYLAARYAPVLYGRNLPAAGGRLANNHTDTPLVAWHQVLPAATPGHSVIEYSVIWSNEDGGTNTPGLMAQWGRSTDIEWVYRVEVDAAGRRVPGTGVIQAPGHQTLPFKGRYDGTHPLIQTCTSNNNVCDKVDDPMRFALSTRGVLPAGQPREHEMDTHPWTYQVMAREMLREGKIESPSDPSTAAVGDQRSYLYIAVDHDTVPAASASGIGLTVEVHLVGDPTTYTSNHGVVFWSINRDGPAATTVELPVGTTPADVASISVRRVPLVSDDGATLEVTDVTRAFFLRSSYLPGPSFVSWHGDVSLTTASPTADLWLAR
jgi:hypothetical protein